MTSLRDIREQQLKPMPELDAETVSLGLEVGREHYLRRNTEEKIKLQTKVDTLEWVITQFIKGQYGVL